MRVVCRRKVAHRNLRAENILLSGSFFQPVVKISGFGYSLDNALDSIAVTQVGDADHLLLIQCHYFTLADVMLHRRRWPCQPISRLSSSRPHEMTQQVSRQSRYMVLEKHLLCHIYIDGGLHGG